MVTSDDQVVRNPSSGCYYPLIKVEVFVDKLPGENGGIHYATVAWVEEKASDKTIWYSGWFAPHNDCGTYHRAELLDFLGIEQVLAIVEMFALRRATEENIKKLGITNQYISRRNRARR